MKKTAVVGVVGSGRINQCVECRAQGVADGESCGGFGPGCFLPKAAQGAPAPAEERVAFRPEKLKPKKRR
jgi:hypothetical protein